MEQNKTENGQLDVPVVPVEAGDNANEEQAKLPNPPKPEVRLDYYQTDADVVASLYLKNQRKEDVSVDFSHESFRVRTKLPDGTDYEREIHLAKNINTDLSRFKVLGTKIEIYLRKLEAGTWPALEAEKGIKEFRPTYPTSSKKNVNWDAVVKNEKEEEADVNSLFSQIYESGDENTKKAMIKSMQESGGTVLSTNWDEVGSKRVEVSPPDGMEFKKY